MKQKLLLFFLVSCTHLCRAVITIQASSLSCAMPTEINESAIIELDVPLNIDGPGTCQLITAGAGFGLGDTVTFRPTQSNTITITSVTQFSDIGMIEIVDAGMWDTRSFDQTTQTFIFESVEIIMQPGGSILADGLKFQLRGTSNITTQAVSLPA